EACSRDSNTFVALRRKPIDRRPGIKHGLAIRLQSPTYVCAHHIIGTLKSRKHSPVVIWEAQTQCSYSGTVQEFAQSHVFLKLCIPMRQYDHCATSRSVHLLRGRSVHATIIVTYRKVTPIDSVVLGEPSL